MKYISVTELKSKQSTPQKILEETLKITPTNLKETKTNISLPIEDLEKLREGLLLKKEEIKREIQKKSPKQLISDFQSFEKQFESKFPEIGATKCILDQHAEIKEMRLTHRIVNLLFEMEKGNLVLDNLLGNEDDWSFLCIFLSTVIRITQEDDFDKKNDNNETNINDETYIKDKNEFFKAYLKKTEEEITRKFEESYSAKNKGVVKKCFDALKEIGKEQILIKSFMYSLPIFQEIKKEKNEKSIVEMDCYEESNSFTKYIEDVNETYQYEIHEFCLLFPTYHGILDTVNKKLFEMTITDHLAYILNNKDPIIFLLDLTLCYSKVSSLTDTISSINVDFESDEYLNELFLPYTSEALHFEKMAFDLLFDIMARKKRSNKTYMLEGESIHSPDFKPIKITSKFILLTNLMLKRSKILKYDTDTINEYYKHFIKKMKEFIVITAGNFLGTERLELIKTLTDVYQIIKKYFSNTPFFSNYEEALNDRIDLIFESRIEESQVKVKHVTKKITIKEFDSESSETVRRLIELLQRENRVLTVNVQGKNEIVFMEKIMDYVHKRIKTDFLSLVYDEKQAMVFYNEMKRVYKFVKEINLNKVYDQFEGLVEIGEILCAKREDLKIFLRAMLHKIPEHEVKAILKCRSDYKEVKKILQI